MIPKHPDQGADSPNNLKAPSLGSIIRSSVGARDNTGALIRHDFASTPITVRQPVSMPLAV
jgi:hypothetical protein